MAKWNRVLVEKRDLDTIGTAFLTGVTREDKVEVLRGGQASEADLADPSVLCIEVGGAGRVEEANFDHHEAGGPAESAIRQAGTFARLRAIAQELGGDEAGHHAHLLALVAYIDAIDVEGARGLGRKPKVSEFPYLSDVFAGMLLTERNPVEQLHKGVELLREVIRTGQNPFGTIRGFDAYAEAKRENNAQIAKAVESARWVETLGGRRLAYLETDFIGAPGALYGAGADIAVAYAPRFGNPPVAKFTVAGNGIKVDAALPGLLALEEGWGGPATGTIIGSPHAGSKLTLAQVVEIVRQAL